MTEEQIQKAFEGRWRIKSEAIIAQNKGQEPITYEILRKYCLDFFKTGILLATVPATSQPKVSTIELRAESFFQQVHAPEFTAKYPEQLLADFFSYWSEPNKRKTKMRFELQKTWDLSRRLATWARNDFNHYGNSTNNDQRTKLAAILTP